MRILAGQCRGRLVKRPRGIRPTSAKVTAALFNIAADAVQGARFLDVCAGSGTVGLEALSRGAAAVTWIERQPSCCRLLADSVARVAGDASARTAVVCDDAPTAIRRLGLRGDQFDLIFVDPPYRDISLLKKTLQAIERHAILPPAGWLIVEHHRRLNMSQLVEKIAVVQQYRYGDTTLSVCRMP